MHSFTTIEKLPLLKKPIIEEGETLDSYIRREADVLDWKILTQSIDLNELSFKTIREFKENWDWDFILLHKNLSNEFMKEFRKEIFLFNPIPNEVNWIDDDIQMQDWESVIGLKLKTVFNNFASSYSFLQTHRFINKVSTVVEGSLGSHFLRAETSFKENSRNFNIAFFVKNEYDKIVELKIEVSYTGTFS